MLEVVWALLKDLDTGKKRMPPTLLYNEGWLLRIVMHWFSQNQVTGHPLSFQPGAEWYSEGMLSSQFLPVYRGDELAESYTHADGIVGNISVGQAGKGDVFLAEPFEQFLVLEAKLFSKLSAGTKNAAGYDQAARGVACMADVISRSGCSLKDFKSLGFYVLAPETKINDEPSFAGYMQKKSVHQKVLSRVESYKERPDYPEKRSWFEGCFEPLLSIMDLQLISWEELIEIIMRYDNDPGKKFKRFYLRCLAFNF